MSTNRTYKVAGPHTWAIAREAYLAGEPARSICDRLGLGLTNFRKRAAAEGWTRRAQAKARDGELARQAPPAPPPRPAAPFPPLPEPEPEPEPDVPDLTAAEVARLAVREAGRALAAGDAGRATQGLKAAELLIGLVAAHPALDPDGAFAPPPEPTFTPARDIIALLAERFGVDEFEGRPNPTAGMTPEHAARTRAYMAAQGPAADSDGGADEGA